MRRRVLWWGYSWNDSSFFVILDFCLGCENLFSETFWSVFLRFFCRFSVTFLKLEKSLCHEWLITSGFYLNGGSFSKLFHRNFNLSATHKVNFIKLNKKLIKRISNGAKKPTHYIINEMMLNSYFARNDKFANYIHF